MVPVSVIADLIVSQLGDNTASKKFLFMQYIALGFQKMHIFLNKDVCIKTEVLPFDGYSMELPDDFIYETKVGIKRGNCICPLYINSGNTRSHESMNDSDTLATIDMVLNGEIKPNKDECYFYNSRSGTLTGNGRGFSKNNYYDISNGKINLSTCLPDDECVEIVVEYKSDGLSGGLSLVPSEAFLALKEFALAQYNGEGPYGPHQMNWESEYKTLKRLYNFKSVDLLSKIISNN